MSRTTTLAALVAAAIAAAVAAGPAEAKAKNFSFFKNGSMYSFKAYKLRRNPPLYAALHKAFGLGSNWGPTMYIPVPSNEPSAQSSSGSPSSPPDRDPCSYGGGGGA